MDKKNQKNNYKDLIKLASKDLTFYNINKIKTSSKYNIRTLPYSYKILLENLLRNLGESSTTNKDILNLIERKTGKEIQFKPSRVLMQDYTGVPAVADLAAMRDFLQDRKINPQKINPKVPVSLVIDHSITVDSFGTSNSKKFNVTNEFLNNMERYKFLKWAQKAFKNFEVFPPGSGICHQINLEFIAKVVSKKGQEVFFDTVVGTDSHTTMINALCVLGWGVGGIEAESVILGQSISMQIPEVIGVNLSGELNEGVTATDLVLSITEKLRKHGVVGKFIEFYGDGLKNLSLSERSTISNMAPEYGATCGLFPIDAETLKYLELTGRSKSQVDLVKNYSKTQGTWHDAHNCEVKYDKVIRMKLDQIESSLAGPKRPQDRVSIKNLGKVFFKTLSSTERSSIQKKKLTHGSVCIASITSCTNTSNPSILITAGLIAQKAVSYGINVPDWVKTSFAPGSQVVEEYLKKADLLFPLEKLGFNIVGYGCTTCIGNSGPLEQSVENKIAKNSLNVCSVLSGNRNFEGRIHPLIKSNFLASPPLVILYALAGTVNLDLGKDPINSKKNLFLKDLWPSSKEVKKILDHVLNKNLFIEKYRDIFSGDNNWKKISTSKSSNFNWAINSTYIKKPPFLDLVNQNNKKKIESARPLLILGDSVTTDHISPAGVIKKNSVAANYLSQRQIPEKNFNSFGSRRGNHEVMVRGTFANIRIKNKMVNKEGGYSVFYPDGHVDEVFEIAEKYKIDSTDLIVFAGKEYGTGSSRDWAAKGTKLLGVKAVIAESFERIHRSNLVGMGILPLEIIDKKASNIPLIGNETFSLGELGRYQEVPNSKGEVKITFANGKTKVLKVISRIDTLDEIKFYKANGIMPYVVNKLTS